MEKWIFIFGMATLILISGCTTIQPTENTQPTEDTQPTTEYVCADGTIVSDPLLCPEWQVTTGEEIQYKTISGVDEVISVKYSLSTVLTISGVRNTVTIERNSNVTKLIISGIDNVIRIPENEVIDIVDSGVRNEIERY